jgi:hypothetical protein
MNKNKDFFTSIYYQGLRDNLESVSGLGSYKKSTSHIVRELPALFNKMNIKTILDAPCGDWNWMKDVSLEGIKYSGADIVEEVISKNNDKYSSQNVDFFLMDIIQDEIKTYDLIVMRDVLVHLSNEDIFSVLRNVKNSKSKFLLTTHFTWINDYIFAEKVRINSQIETGGWRRINLEESPFNLPYPIKVIVEGHTHSEDVDKSLALYLIEDIPNF